MRRKIGKTIILIVLMMGIGISSLMWAGMYSLRNTVQENELRLSEHVTEMAYDSMSEEIEKSSAKQAVLYARYYDDWVRVIERDILVLADSMTEIFSEDVRASVNRTAPGDGEQGLTVLKTGHGVSLSDPLVQDETELLYSGEKILRQICDKSETIASCYMTTENNVTLWADAAYRDENNEFTKEAFFDGTGEPWYVGAKEAGDVFITQVYPDVYGYGAAFMCGAPFYRGKELAGVVGATVYIDYMINEIKSIEYDEDGFACVMGQNGEILISPREGIFGIRYSGEADLRKMNEPELKEFVDTALLGQFHSQTFTAGGEEYYVVSVPMDTIYCYFMLVIPTQTMRRPVVELTDHIAASTGESLEAARRIMALTGLNLLIFGLIIIGVVYLIGHRVSMSIVEPIRVLTDEVKNTVDDYFEFEWTLHSGDETDILGQSFEEMTKRLKEYIANLTRMTSEKERIETELSVAAEIQTGMLPRNFQVFSNLPQMEIFASMRAAREVGGDFYDFFRIDEKHIGIMIGDVSGKGVPAALFMVMARTCLKDMARLGLKPSEVMERANNILHENNENMLFVTVWLGILNAETGVIDYVNAGHNPPVVYKKGKGFTYLACNPNIIMAAFPDRKYVQEQAVLAPGEMLLLYTDGVTEATNEEGLLYGEERLLEYLGSRRIYDTRDVIEKISEELSEFQGSAEQFDDITMLALKYKSMAEDV